MSLALKNLLILLNLEKIEEGLLRGQSEDLGLRQVPGEQAVGRAPYVAKETIPEECLVHSFHSYLLRPGDSQKSIIYDAEVLHDGNSFSACRVVIIQNGKPILYATAFSQASEDRFEHQKTIPDALSPGEPESKTGVARSVACLLPPLLKEKFTDNRPLEVRPVEFHNPLKGHIAPPARQVRVRANSELQDDLRVHQYLPGCVSDLNFLPIALQPCRIGFLEEGVQIATIDHSMWFHRPSNINERLLYNAESTSAFGARGFVHGEFYTQNSMLVTSTVQEGVVHNHNRELPDGGTKASPSGRLKHQTL